VRITVSLLFVIIILVQYFTKTWIILSFKMNQDYIAKVLCINKNKPQLHCDGKCILMLKIRANEENQQKKMPQVLKIQNEISYCLQILNPHQVINLVAEMNQNLIDGHQNLYKTSFEKSIFRPPQSGPLNKFS